ncbi:MAG: nucleotidyltransferase domain-containing protein [Candidatus Binatia bacterium]
MRKKKAILEEAVRRIVAVAHPDEIILFGSAARGQLRRHSDFDLLVVKSGVSDRRRLAQKIHIHFFGIPVPIDVIVVTPEEVHRSRSKGWTFLGRVLREGKRIYQPRTAVPAAND